MSELTSFGLFAVTAMLVTYALETRSRWFILAFSVACVLGSIYGLAGSVAVWHRGRYLVAGRPAPLVASGATTLSGPPRTT